MKRTKVLRTFFIALMFSFFLFPLNSLAASDLSEQPSGAPVEPFGNELFTIYGDIGSVTAEKRAHIISENIIRLSKDAFFKADYINIDSSKETTNIRYKDEVIMGVTALQAKTESKSKAEAASHYAEVISDAILKERSEHLRLLRIEEIGIALLIVIVAVLCIKGLNIFLNYINNLFLRKKNLQSSKDKDITEEVQFTFKIIKTLRIILVAFVIIICFLIFLWLFPATRWLVESLLSYIEKPLAGALLSVWHYIPNLIEIIILIVLFRIFERFLNFIAKKLAAGTMRIKGFDSDWAMPTFQILRVLIVVFAFIFIFPLLPKADSSVFKGISVFMGVLLSLGSTSMISNIVSGLVITYMRPFNVGDRIQMGEHFGDVIEKNSLVTRIRTTKNEIVTIPNSTIMTANTTNYTNSAKTYGLILHSFVTVGYDIDWRKVHGLLIEAASKTEGVLQEPKPFVHQAALDDFYVKYEINVYINDAGRMTAVYSDLFQNIQDIFNREKIELLSPHYNAVRNDGGPVFPKA